ncbi:MAG: tRNA 2-thiouridine(34) synthase MnmA [Lachnospiraceae bacterium]|nr:tRNA 2-thiouridine(34) synthase MnmA [Lachnospiraceae bacterium]
MKALIAMSGGVDSSVAALLMKEAGWDCIGCTMKLYNNDDLDLPAGQTCCSLDDVEDARSVCRRLQIPFYVFNYQADFRRYVIDRFVQCYECGLTPNPCVDCNRFIKLNELFLRAAELSCDCVVTGHYARVEETPDGYVLKKARCAAKDQTYVLYNLTQEQLAHLRLPLGELEDKDETRRLAETHSFRNHAKPDSQDICFVPDGDYAAAVERFSGRKSEPGDFIDTDGRFIARHKGIIHYTLGQRKGLGLSFAEPHFVTNIDPENRTVTLGLSQDLFRTDGDAADFHWISGRVPEGPVRCTAKIRYRHKEAPATVTPTGPDTVHVSFDEPQRAFTPGQSLVLYDGEICLGGGILVRS